MAEEKRPTVGYDREGNAKTFHLLAGQKLPAGYSDTPPEGTHPNQPHKKRAPDPEPEPEPEHNKPSSSSRK